MSEVLSDEEQLERIKNWWQKNGVALLIGLVVVIGGSVGWRSYQNSVAEDTAVASDLYEAFLSADDATRESLAAQIDEKHPGSAYQVFSLLYRAKASLLAGDTEACAAHLSAAVEASSNQWLADFVRLRLARVLQQLDRTDEAMSHLGKIRTEGFRSYVQELQGDIHFSRGDTDLAHQSYVSALGELRGTGQRPILEIKVNDTAKPNAS
ncbi:MAG: tetratricopeptide repeat protein [Proteobacteria bacterium]|nr:tetratricopeptide repeat protein [Pseudomonadota bacterium]